MKFSKIISKTTFKFYETYFITPNNIFQKVKFWEILFRSF